MKKFQMERILSNKYNHLLVVLIVTFLLSPFISDRLRIFNISLLTILLLGATLFALRTVVQKTKTYYSWVFAVLLALVLSSLGYMDFVMGHGLDEICKILSFLIIIAYLVFTVIVLLKRLFTVKKVTVDTIKGGICVYFLLGIVWACLYFVVYVFDPGAFTCDGGGLFYFSYTTLTTVGYGDIAPVHPFARTPVQPGRNYRAGIPDDFCRSLGWSIYRGRNTRQKYLKYLLCVTCENKYRGIQLLV